MEMPVEALGAPIDNPIDLKYILSTKHSQVNAPPTGDVEDSLQDIGDICSTLVPRKRRSGTPHRRPGTAWFDVSRLAALQDMYTEGEPPAAPFMPAASLKAEDEEEIAAALFDLAQTGRTEPVDEPAEASLPSPRKRPRKPSRNTAAYETAYDDDEFDDDWDAEDEYLAKRRGGANWRTRGGGGASSSGGAPSRPSRRQGPQGANRSNAAGFAAAGDDVPDIGRSAYNGPRSNGPYGQAPGALPSGPLRAPGPPAQAPAPPRFKPGPNHVAISHFIQWHRQIKGPVQPPSSNALPPPALGGPIRPSQPNAAQFGAMGPSPPQNQEQVPPSGPIRPPMPPPQPSGFNTSAIASLLPALQTGMRQSNGSAPQPGPGGGAPQPMANLGGLLGQMAASGGGGGQGRGGSDVLDLLQQLISRQTAAQNNAAGAPPHVLQPHKGQPTVPGMNGRWGHAPPPPPAAVPMLAHLRQQQQQQQHAQQQNQQQQNHHQQQQQQQQQQHARSHAAIHPPTAAPQPGQPQVGPAAFQALRALLAASSQRSQQQQGPSRPDGVAPGPPMPSVMGSDPSHAEMLRLVKESLNKAKARQVGDVAGGMHPGGMPYPGALPHPSTAQVAAPSINQMPGAEAVPSEPITAPKVEENGATGTGNDKDAGVGGPSVLDLHIKHQLDQPGEPAGVRGAVPTFGANQPMPMPVDNGTGPVGDSLPRHVPSTGPGPVNTLDAMRAYLMQRKHIDQNQETQDEKLPTETTTEPPSVTMTAPEPTTVAASTPAPGSTAEAAPQPSLVQ